MTLNENKEPSGWPKVTQKKKKPQGGCVRLREFFEKESYMVQSWLSTCQEAAMPCSGQHQKLEGH